MTSPIQAANNSNVFRTRAFTLLELLLVVIIMGIVYSMVSISMPRDEKKLPVLSAGTLGAVLASVHDGKAYTFYLYGQECEYASIIPPLPEGLKLGAIAFSRDVEAFETDPFGSVRRIEFAPVRIEGNDYKVCLKFDKRPNGSTSHFIIKDGNRYYQTNPYTKQATSAASVDEVVEASLHKAINPDFIGAK